MYIKRDSRSRCRILGFGPILIGMITLQFFVQPAIGQGTVDSSDDRAESSKRTRSFEYNDGKKTRRVWMSDDEVTVYPRDDHGLTKTKLATLADTAGLLCDSVDVGDRRCRIKTKMNLSTLTTSELKDRLSQLDSNREIVSSTPAFYGSRTSDETIMLSDRVVIRFPDEWDDARIQSWARAKNLVKINAYNFSPKTCIFKAASRLDTVTIPDDVCRSGEVVYAYPDWFVQGEARIARPANDDFDQAEMVAGTNGCAKGTNIDASKEGSSGDSNLNEPDHAGQTGGRSIWYSWSAPMTGNVTFTTVGSRVRDSAIVDAELDTVLAVYTGTSFMNADLTEADSNNDRGSGSIVSSVTIMGVSTGTDYKIAVDGVGGAQGFISLDWAYDSFTPANDNFSQAQNLDSIGNSGSVTTLNRNATMETNEPPHDGNVAKASIWYTWTVPAGASVSINTFGSVIDTVLAVYTGSALNGLSLVGSSNDDCENKLSRVAFTNSEANPVIYYIAVDSVNGAQGCITLNWDDNPEDELFVLQWYLENTGQDGGRAGEDINVGSVWSNYTGQNQVIAIVDNGLDIDHPDISPNVLSGVSHNFVADAQAPFDPADPIGGDHGTAVGGIAAARGFNSIGIRGTAPDGNLVGFRLFLDDGVSFRFGDAAMALERDKNVIDIYNNSWGSAPLVAGDFFRATRMDIDDALKAGFKTGRHGLGNVYTWAAGNGGPSDNANYDEFTNSRYTIAVASTNNLGVQTGTSEKGANLFVNAPSGGGTTRITTTDRTGADGFFSSGDYHCNFTGTSAAAPIVSGVVALMLEANPLLTARDVMAILLVTAEKNDPTDSDWDINGVGFHINHKYGFGRVDAHAAVAAAETWSNLSPEVILDPSVDGNLSMSPNEPIPDNNSTGITKVITVTDNTGVDIVEYVEVMFTASHSNWGHLEIVLESPAGTQSILAEKHNIGSSRNPLDDWPFGSIRHFGESPVGDWKLTVKDLTAGIVGNLDSWSLKIYGKAADQVASPGMRVFLITAQLYPDEFTFDWVQTSTGTSVSLINANTMRPHFDVPAGSVIGEILEFRLTVTDTFSNTSIENVMVAITEPYQYDLHPGWNQIGMPFDLSRSAGARTIGQIFSSDGVASGDLKAGSLWGWNGTQLAEVFDSGVMQAKNGYLVYNNSSTVVQSQPFTGVAPNNPNVILKFNSWNFVAPIKDIIRPTGAITGSIWGLESSEFVPIEANAMLTFLDSYWIFSPQGGTLNLNQ